MKTLSYCCVLLLSLAVFQSCNSNAQSPVDTPSTANVLSVEALQKADSLAKLQAYEDSLLALKTAEEAALLAAQQIKDSLAKMADSAWVDLEWAAPDMIFDIRYATTNNFVEEVMYDCPKCFIRAATAKALIKAQENLKKQYGYNLKIFDCYRPLDVQKKLWKKLPDRRYVADPAKGSMHNRGLALDLTLVDKDGNEFDMGTHFDYFGKEAYPSYTGHSAQINKNRQILRTALEAQGFGVSTTEWWHFSYRKQSFPVSNYQWSCE